jgi:hypothetical protein
MLKVMRWDDDDAIAYDPLRMTSPDDIITCDVRLCAFHNQKMNGRIFMQFGGRYAFVEKSKLTPSNILLSVIRHHECSKS